MPTRKATLPLMCGYCYKTLRDGEALYCSGCHTRPYCSKACQISDWKVDRQGQCHKVWCSLGCGEQNVDYVITHISDDKGYGIIANVPIPRGRIIMCEHVFPVNQVRQSTPLSSVRDAIMSLVPENGKIDDKIDTNCIGLGSAGEGVCIRISRINHACMGNSFHHYDSAHGVVLLISTRDIGVGEEIEMDYTARFDVAAHDEHGDYETCTSTLKMRYGIVCKNDCKCHDRSIQKLVMLGRALDQKIIDLARSHNYADAIKSGKLLLDVVKRLDLPPNVVNRALFNLYEVCTASGANHEGLEYLRRAYDSALQIYGPESANAKFYKQYIDEA